MRFLLLIILIFSFGVNASYGSKKTYIIQLIDAKKALNNSYEQKKYIAKINFLVDNLNKIQLNYFLIKINNLEVDIKNNNEYKNIFNYFESKIKLKHKDLTLNISDHCLINLNNEDITKLNKGLGLSYTLEEWCYLEEIYITGKDIVIPKEIGKLYNLKSVVLAHNNINNIPKEVGNLIYLHTLDLGLNNINTIPKEIGKLVNLETLKLNVNNINNLPNDLKYLKKIKNLWLSGNEGLKSLAKIYQLNSGIFGGNDFMGNMNIRVFPHMKNVEIRILTEKELIESQDCKFTLNQKDANILHNAFNYKYTEVEWCNIRLLEYVNKNLSYIPKEIGKLNNLTSLNLSNNDIEIIPDEISNLENLNNLNLSQNNIQNLPKDISNFKYLEKLYLDKNPGLEPLNKNYGGFYINSQYNGGISIKYNIDLKYVQITEK